MTFSKKSGALLVAAIVMAAWSVPASAKCVRAGGKAVNMFPNVAKYMANVALKNSIASHGWKSAGKIRQRCTSDGVMTTCVSKQRACN